MELIKRSKRVIKNFSRNPGYYFGKVLDNVSHSKFRRRFLSENGLEKYFLHKNGLEIGGPSRVFSGKGIFPIYRLLDSLDGCNFTTHTVWEGMIEQGSYHFYPGKTGNQFICEGSLLGFSRDGQYDFLLSSHSLEHHANVIKTLKEWKRVVKAGGLLLIIVPEKRFTFDHKREYTKFEHFIEDEKRGTEEDDLTHLEEILKLHDRSRDPGAGDAETFKKRGLDNYTNRCLHQHVFNFENLSQLASYLDLEILTTKSIRPYHNIIFLKKK